MNQAALEPQGNAEMLRLLTCSDLRKNLLLSLRNGAATLADLRDETGATSTAAIHALRELEKERLTAQDEKRNYLLTSSGKVVALHLDNFVKTLDVISQFGEFWLEHDLSGIPDDFVKNIGALRESHLLTSTTTDIFNAFSTFVTLLEKAKTIKGVLPVFTPGLFDIFADLAGLDKPIELVVTHDVLNTMLPLIYRSERKDVLRGNLKLFVIEKNPKTVFTVTDYFFVLGLFRFNGTYDYSDTLLSYTPEGITWGCGLFDHYAGTAEVFELSDREDAY